MFDALGLDEDNFVWQDLGLCRGHSIWRFYEGYESHERIARLVDSQCNSCPVQKQCLQAGVENNEWGVWGGVYLINGKPEPTRNAHKTREDWADIRSMIENE